MDYDCGNIFKTARENAGFTQEHAAELLEVNVKTISNWECYNFKTIKDENVVKMAKVYNDHTIVLKWLTMFSDFKEFLPEFLFEGISSAIINVIDTDNDFEDIRKKLVKVLKDKKVDEQEKEDWTEIRAKSLALAGALISLIAQCDN